MNNRYLEVFAVLSLLLLLLSIFYIIHLEAQLDAVESKDTGPSAARFKTQYARINDRQGTRFTILTDIESGQEFMLYQGSVVKIRDLTPEEGQ